VFLPDEVQYPPLLQAVAHEYGLPLHFSWGQPLITVPQVDIVLKLLRLSIDQFSRRSFLDVLRSPYLDLKNLGFELIDATRMERVSRFGPVVAGYENWQRVLKRLADNGDSQKNQPVEDDEGNIYALPGVEVDWMALETFTGIGLGYTICFQWRGTMVSEIEASSSFSPTY